MGRFRKRSNIVVRLYPLLLVACAAGIEAELGQTSALHQPKPGPGSGTLSYTLGTLNCQNGTNLEQGFSLYYDTTCNTKLDLDFRWYPQQVASLPKSTTFYRKANSNMALSRLETYKVPSGHRVDRVDIEWRCLGASLRVDVLDQYCMGPSNLDVQRSFHQDTQILGQPVGPVRARYVFDNPCGNKLSKANSRVIFHNKSAGAIGLFDVVLNLVNGERMPIEPLGTLENPGFPADLAGKASYSRTLLKSGLASLDVWAVQSNVIDQLEVREIDIRCR